MINPYASPAEQLAREADQSRLDRLHKQGQDRRNRRTHNQRLGVRGALAATALVLASNAGREQVVEPVVGAAQTTVDVVADGLGRITGNEHAPNSEHPPGGVPDMVIPASHNLPHKE